jgi:hypothetical protein
VSRRRKIALAAAGVALAAAVGFGLFGWYLPTRRAVAVGAGMLAKQICSCVYVAKRSVEDCRADQFSSMDPIQLEVRGEEQRVRAFVPALGERSAVHREGLGCTLE